MGLTINPLGSPFDETGVTTVSVPTGDLVGDNVVSVSGGADSILNVSDTTIAFNISSDAAGVGEFKIALTAESDGLLALATQTDIDHDAITNTHNLTTDIDHNSITNTHNLSTDIDHNGLTNTHQDVGTGSSPTFAGQTITGLSGVGVYSAGVLSGSAALSDLSDVLLDTPVADDVLTYNGAEWVNGKGTTVSGGLGVSFFLDDTSIIAKGTDNNNEVNSLLKIPAGGSQVVDTIACASNTVLGEAYLYDTAIGETTIPAGEWLFNIYGSVSSIIGGRVSTITQNIYRVMVDSVNTVTVTGTGTSRTATVSGGTPFIAGDANASITVRSYLRTAKGLYGITGYTSATEVTIETPSGYTNDSGSAFSVWRKQFGVTTPTITALNTNYILQTIREVQGAITIAATDKLGTIMFGTSNNTTNVFFTHNGTEHYTYFRTPLATKHNDLTGLQGGSSTERYHLTAAQVSAIGESNVYKTSDYTITNTDGYTCVIASGSGTDITLPDVSANINRKITIKRLDASNTITIKRYDANTIDGDATDYPIDYDKIAVTLLGTSSGWVII